MRVLGHKDARRERLAQKNALGGLETDDSPDVLNVGFLLEGSVRKAGGGLRISSTTLRSPFPKDSQQPILRRAGVPPAV